eukprot:COSAG06_NODE_2362_length_7003_cov_15.069815_1_plen_88_part_00
MVDVPIFLMTRRHETLSDPAGGGEGGANCTNVWGRVLEPGRRYALAFVNNANASVELSCDTACFTELLDGAPPAVRFNLPLKWIYFD